MARRRTALWVGGGILLLVLGGVFAWALLMGRGADRIALIALEGVITDSKGVVDQLERYREHPGIRAIVIRINSPGGAVAPSQEIYEELVKVRERAGKPVVASMGTVAASGGYYIASAADRIVANPGTITGSIGVIMQVPNVAGLLQKVGVKTVVIKSGEHKDLANPTRDLTEGERQILQGVLDDVHGQFIEAVARGRRLERGAVEGLADGRIFSGRQALTLGLVDQLGDLPDAIQWAAQRAGIPGKPRIVQERRRRFSLLELLGAWDILPPGSVPLGGFSIDYLLR